jgi:3-methylcrotonyl-CoA carboxylase alpha subunit
MMFKKILIANRGEIAVRVMRTAHEMGIRTVAVFSEADRLAKHVMVADEAVFIGPSPSTESYLNIPRIIQAAKECGAEAIHPGYGFLAENPLFSEAVGQAGLVFIGPPPQALRLLGNKIDSRRLVESLSVPIIPGATFEAPEPKLVAVEAEKIGWPVLIKAAAGGGGKGMRVVHKPAELPLALESAVRESGSAFGDATVYIEKYLPKPRHIEFQIFLDEHGNAVFLGERECSVQRRHQKIIEESPSPIMNPQLRARVGEAALKVARAAGYRNAGTVEFLFSDSQFYFLEVNARLQVEHPVTEFVTGQDLVEWQLRVAAGEPLPKTQKDLTFRGHAIECRIYAEDPAHGFLPSSGRIVALEEPHIPGVRVDSGIYEGCEVPVFYDPILSKVIAFAPTRETAIRKMRTALSQYVLLGVAAPIEILCDILDHPEFAAGRLSTHFLTDHFLDWKPSPPSEGQVAGALLAATRAAAPGAATGDAAPRGQPSPWLTLGSWQIAQGKSGT